MKPANPPFTTGQIHRTSLDGVRALAILGVLFVHAGVPGAKSGWIGVDLFFVLSGFLITTLLAMEVRATGAIDWSAFLIRRALRLMPAYFLYAGVVTIAIWCWPSSERGQTGGWTAAGLTAAIWTYTLNFVPQGGVWNGQGALVHLWSLSVEQQYYLVWPIVVMLLLSRPRFLRLFSAAAALVCALMFIFAPAGLYKDHMLYTRGFSLIAASSLALYAAHSPAFLISRHLRRITDLLGIACLGALFCLPYLAPSYEGRIPTLILPLLVAVFALWVGRLWYVEQTGHLRALLQNRFVVYVGKVSYGIYLYHELIRIGVWYWMKAAMVSWPPALGFAARLTIYLLLSFLLAAGSYELFEKRVVKYATRFRPARAAVA